MKQLIIPALLALMIAGCSSTPDGSEQDGAPVESRNSGVATVNAGGIDGRNLPAVLTDPKSILSKRSVYFDYDSYVVKDEFQALLAAHGKFLAANAKMSISTMTSTKSRPSTRIWSLRTPSSLSAIASSRC